MERLVTCQRNPSPHANLDLYHALRLLLLGMAAGLSGNVSDAFWSWFRNDVELKTKICGTSFVVASFFYLVYNFHIRNIFIVFFFQINYCSFLGLLLYMGFYGVFIWYFCHAKHFFRVPHLISRRNWFCKGHLSYIILECVRYIYKLYAIFCSSSFSFTLVNLYNSSLLRSFI